MAASGGVRVGGGWWVDGDSALSPSLAMASFSLQPHLWLLALLGEEAEFRRTLSVDD